MKQRLGLVLATVALVLAVSCGSSKEVTRAREFIDARMFDQAIVLLNQEIQQNPKNAEAHMLLGESYLGKGMSGQAEQEFNTATLLDKDLTSQVSKDCYALGKDLAKNDKANAHRALMMAVKYDPSLERDEQFYFLTYIDTEDTEGARTDAAKKYLILFPSGANQAQATYAVAEGLLSNGTRDEAKTYFQQVATKFPGTEWGKKASDQLASWLETKELNLDAQRTAWTDSGMQVQRGDAITIEASGVVNHGGPQCGPDGNPNITPNGDAVVPRARFGALVGRIGSTEPIVVGSHYQTVATNSGSLQFLVNDTAGQYADNAGSFEVRISIKKTVQ